MPLIKCPECGKDISDSAPSCPNCGYQLNVKKEVVNEPPITEVKKKPKKKGLGCLVAIILFSLFCLFVANCAKDSDSFQKDLKGFDKSAATEFDTEVWGVLLPVARAHNNLVDAMTKYSEGSISELEFYNFCKELSEYAKKAYSAYPNNKNKDAKEYVDYCKSYTLYLQKSVDSIITYIDSKSTKNLSTVQENLENTKKAASIAITSRGKFLTTFGYTTDEVKQMASEAAAAIAETDGETTADN